MKQPNPLSNSGFTVVWVFLGGVFGGLGLLGGMGSWGGEVQGASAPWWGHNAQRGGKRTRAPPKKQQYWPTLGGLNRAGHNRLG
jgi:hypothetical protein